MLRVLDRYILSEYLRYFLFAVFGLTLSLFIAEYLRGVWDENVSPWMLLQYSAFNIPMIFCQMVAPAVMLATMLTLSQFNRRNELTAMHAAGVSLRIIAGLLSGATFVICCLTLVIYDRIVPPAAKGQNAFYWHKVKGRPDFTLDIKTSKIWYRSKNHIYNLRTYDKATSTIQGFGVYFFDRNFRLVQEIESREAKYDAQSKLWKLNDGMVTIFPEGHDFPMSKHFDDKTLSLPETPTDFIEIEKQVETLRLKDLQSFIRRNKEAGLNTKKYEVHFHSRIALSFVALAMGLIAVPYSVRPKRQGGIGFDLLVCFGWIFLYWLLFSISLSLGRSGAVEPELAVWAPSALFLLAAIALVWRGRAGDNQSGLRGFFSGNPKN